MANGKAILLTTIDNPYSPFDEFKQWFNWDVLKGYNTCAYLDRVSLPSEYDEGGVDLNAINEIVRHNLSGKHIAITKEEFDSRTLDE